MNTHDIDIELPAEFRSGNKALIKAAIEVLRHRRGEPVAWAHEEDLGSIISTKKKNAANATFFRYSIPLYATPQPAEGKGNE